MYEQEAKAVRYWGRCPLCQGVNCMLDYGREFYCQACDRWLAKWVVEMENKPENQSTAAAGGGAIRKSIYLGGEELANQDSSTKT